jgi:hypothetical protein
MSGEGTSAASKFADALPPELLGCLPKWGNNLGDVWRVFGVLVVKLLRSEAVPDKNMGVPLRAESRAISKYSTIASSAPALPWSCILFGSLALMRPPVGTVLADQKA